METIPWVDRLPWAEIGALISGLLIGADLLRSYAKAKAAEAEAAYLQFHAQNRLVLELIQKINATGIFFIERGWDGEHD